VSPGQRPEPGRPARRDSGWPQPNPRHPGPSPPNPGRSRSRRSRSEAQWKRLGFEQSQFKARAACGGSFWRKTSGKHFNTMVSLVSSLGPMGAGFLPSLRSSHAFMPFGMDLFTFRTIYHCWNCIMIHCLQFPVLSNALWRPNVHSREPLATENLNYRYM
jgi:hypothetical protein